MKFRIYIPFLIMSLVCALWGITFFDNSDKYSIENNQTISLKSGQILFNEMEQQVVEHSEIVELEYYINGISSINNMILSYETSNDNISINFEQTSNNEFSVSLRANDIGENSVDIVCILNLNNGNQINLNDEIFIYSREDYDFLSKASILDAKFYCYAYITNTSNPSFEEYDEFYSNNQSNNNISTNSIGFFKTPTVFKEPQTLSSIFACHCETPIGLVICFLAY